MPSDLPSLLPSIFVPLIGIAMPAVFIVINLPINTIKTAGIAIPINGTKIEGKRLGKSDGIIL